MAKMRVARRLWNSDLRVGEVVEHRSPAGVAERTGAETAAPANESCWTSAGPNPRRCIYAGKPFCQLNNLKSRGRAGDRSGQQGSEGTGVSEAPGQGAHPWTVLDAVAARQRQNIVYFILSHELGFR